MKIKAICLSVTMLLVIAMSSPSLAQEKVAQAGLPFLKVGVGARAVAMGESFAAMANDINAIFWNPAGLSSIESREVMFSYTNWIADIKHNAIAAAWTFQGIGTFGVSFVSMNYGADLRVTTVDFDPSNEFGYQGGNRFGGETFSPSEYAAGLAYSRRFTDKFSLGGQVKYVYQSLGSSNVVISGDEQTKKNEVNGLAFDFGTLYHTGIRDLRIGFSIMNFSQDFEYERESFQLPLTFRIGMAMSIWDTETQSVTLSADATHPRDFGERVHFGAEYWYNNLLALRGGYKYNYDEEGLTLGAGLNYDINDNLGLVADYAYASFGSIFGTVNRFSLGLRF